MNELIIVIVGALACAIGAILIVLSLWIAGKLACEIARAADAEIVSVKLLIKSDIGEGDRLLLTTPHVLSPAAYEKLKESCEEAFKGPASPKDFKIIILEQGVKASAIVGPKKALRGEDDG